MSDLGSGLIRVNVKVDGLGTARKNLTGFFKAVRKQATKTLVTVTVLQRQLDSLNASGLGKVAKASSKAAKSIKKMARELKKVEDGIKAVGSKRTTLNTTFAGANHQVTQNIAHLKNVQKELDKINKKQARNNKQKPQGPSPRQDKGFGNAQKIREVGFALRDVGRQALLAAAAITAVFTATVVEGAKFEQAVQNTVSVISGLTDGSSTAKRDIESLTETILELGKTTEFTGVQIADAARQLALSGFSSKEIEDSLESVINLASATNTELQQTALIAARITRAFGLQASTFDNVADTLTAVAANSNTTLEGIGESFKLAAPIAAAYGQSVEDVAIAFGVLGDSGIQNCYDPKTEVLTGEGWKYWENADENDTYATVNKDTHAVEWHKPLRMYEYDYNGQMYKVSNRHTDILVTPNHEMYVSKGSEKYGKYELTEAKNLGPEYRLLAAPTAGVGDTEFFELPEIVGSDRGWSQSTKQIPMDTFLKFLGSYLSEGWCKANTKDSQYRICVAQQRTSEGYNPFKELFDTTEAPLDFNYCETSGRFKKTNKQLHSYLMTMGHGALNKSVPSFIKNLSQRQIRLFLEYYRLGGGDKKRGKSFRLHTYSPQMADDLHELGVLAGYRTYLSSRYTNGGTIRGRKINSNNLCYTISYSNTTDTLIQRRAAKRVKRANAEGRDARHVVFQGLVDYSGKVYCAEVPNNTLIVRRNGKVVVSGNSRAGTGFSRLFSELTEKADTLDEELRAVGSSFEAIDPTKNNFKDIVRVFERLKNAGKINAADLFRLFDQRSARVLVSAVNAGAEAFERLEKVTSESAGLAKNIRDFRIDTIAGDFKLLVSAISAAATAITQSLTPAVRALIQSATSVIKTIGNWVQNNSILVEAIFKVSAGLVILLSVVGTVAVVLGTFASLVGGVALVLAGIASGVLLSLGPLLGFAGGITAVVLGLGAFAGWLISTSGIFTDYRSRVLEATDANAEFLHSLQQMNSSIQQSSDAVSTLRERMELLRELPGLNELQLDRLAGLSPDGGIFDFEETDKDIRNAEEAVFKIAQLIKEKEKIIAGSGGPDDLGIHTGADILSRRFDPNASFFSFRSGSAIKGDAQAEIDILEEGRKEGQDNIDALKEERGQAEELQELYRNATNINDLIIADLEIINRKEELIRQLKAAQIEGRTADQIRINEAQISEARTTITRVRKQAANKKDFRSQTSSESRVLVEQGANQQIDSVQFLRDSKLLAEAVAVRKRLSQQSVKNDKDFLELTSELAEEFQSKEQKAINELSTTENQRLAILSKRGDILRAAVKDGELRIEDLAAEEAEAVVLGNLDGAKALREDMVGLLESQAKLQQGLNSLVGIEKEVVAAALRERKKITEEVRQKQQKIIDDAALAAAKAQGDLKAEIELIKSMGQERIKASLTEFEEDNRGSPTLAADLLALEKSLNATLDEEVSKRLDIKDILENIADIQRDIAEGDVTQLSKDLANANKKADEAQKELLEVRADLQKVFDAETDPTKKAAAGKGLAEIDAAVINNADKRKAAVNKAQAADDKRVTDFTRKQKLATAKRLDDLDEEFRIRKEIATEEAKARVDKALESRSAAERARALAEELIAIDADLADSRTKREKEIADKKKKADAATKKVQDAAKKVNGFAQARADLEAKVADKLLSQVRSLQEAKQLIQFLNRLQSSSVAQARKLGLQSLAAGRKVRGLQKDKAAALQADPNADTSKIDNALARARLNLGIISTDASNQFQKAGLSAVSLADAFNSLKNTVSAAAGTLPKAGTPAVPLGVPSPIPTFDPLLLMSRLGLSGFIPKLPKGVLPGQGAGTTINVEITIPDAGDPKATALAVRSELNLINKNSRTA